MATDVYKLIAERFGAAVEFVENPEITQADATARTFLRQDPTRVAFTITNLSANVIYVRPGANPSSTVGLTLQAGSSLTVQFPEDLHMAALEWRVIDAAGGSAIYTVAVRFSGADAREGGR